MNKTGKFVITVLIAASFLFLLSRHEDLTPIPPGQGALSVTATLDGWAIVADVDVISFEWASSYHETFTTSFTVNLDVGTYDVIVTYNDYKQIKQFQIMEGKVVTWNVRFSTIEPQSHNPTRFKEMI